MNTINEIRQRFGGFSDSVITKFIYKMNSPSEIILEINCKDFSQNNNWVRIELTLYDIQEIIFKEVKTSNQVIGEAIFVEMKDLLVFDFSPYSETSKTAEEFRKSNFVVQCTRFNLEILNNL